MAAGSTRRALASSRWEIPRAVRSEMSSGVLTVVVDLEDFLFFGFAFFTVFRF